MITCMEMKSFILKYASKIMFYDVNIACYEEYQPIEIFGAFFAPNTTKKDI